AFLHAATRGKTDVVAFLLETGCITTKSVDKAFKTAAGPVGGVHSDAVKFLYRKRRGYSESTSKTSKSTDTTQAAQHLCKHERISDKAIVKAFERAIGYEGNADPRAKTGAKSLSFSARKSAFQHRRSV
ncbi:hypothetical protein L914_08668, partial [Phytophthora nicotianae]